MQKILVAPGNGGTAREPGVENVAITDLDALADFAAREQIHLTVVGPEAPLAAGVVDLFRATRAEDLRPDAGRGAARELEGVRQELHAVATAFRRPPTRLSPRRGRRTRTSTRRGAPIVVKADGLAAGKGVVVATTAAEAHAAIDRMLVDRAMGEAGAQRRHRGVPRRRGGELHRARATASTALALATSQDHKRLRDGDGGPNTGGMGAYSPAPVVTPALHARIDARDRHADRARAWRRTACPTPGSCTPA